MKRLLIYFTCIKPKTEPILLCYSNMAVLLTPLNTASQKYLPPTNYMTSF